MKLSTQLSTFVFLILNFFTHFFHCNSRRTFARILFALLHAVADAPLTVTAIHPLTPGAKPKLPLYLSRISAGFPSPADDFMEKKLDLFEELVQHPAATFYVRAEGESMTGAGIFSGDTLIVDRALEPRDGDIVVAVLGGELLVKYLEMRGEQLFLRAANPLYKPIEVTEDAGFEVWGVVTNVFHKLRR